MFRSVARFSLIFLLLSGVGLVLPGGFSGCRGRAAATAPVPRLTQEIYVWQRVWNPEVADAARTAATVADGLIPLAAQVAWRDGRAAATHPNIPWRELSGNRKRLAVALRVDPVPTGRIGLPETESAVVDEARECLRRTDGATVAELHLDFDAAESQLRVYAKWVRAIRAAVAPVPVTFTALPTWLKHPDFPALAKAGDGYVLQVHGCERPTPDSTRLCDPRKARAWVNAASRAAPGVPFRVALPTYAYETAFAPDGACLGLVAEGQARLWPANSRVLRLSANPEELAGLRDGWQHDRPPEMTGLVWFRLPVPGDERNWRWPTLRAMLENRLPRAALSVRSGPSDDNRLHDLTITNTGDADAVADGLPIRADWTGTTCEAGEALPGFVMEIHPDHAIIRRAPGNPTSSPMILRPGSTISLGWLRFASAATELQLNVATDETPTN